MKTIETLTAIVLAKRSLNQKLGEEAVLWADLLLAQGNESNSVKKLAQHDLKASPAQIESYVDVCFSNLGMELVDEKSAHLLLVWAWTQKILKNEITVDQFLENMHQLCLDFQHEPAYMQFYLLACTKKELPKGFIMFHDREVNENNFEQVLRWEIDLFLEQNEEAILDLIKLGK